MENKNADEINDAVEQDTANEESANNETTDTTETITTETDADNKEDVSDSEDNNETDEKDSDKKDKKSVFGKKKDKTVVKLEEKVKELEEARVRQLAEFENFRKRTEKEKSQMFEIGAKSVIEKMLPVIDNFERGMAVLPEDEASKSFVEGVQLVYKQMLTAFTEIGVEPIEAVGTPFDPDIHNAVMAVDDDELESGTVAEELQKGYKYKDSIVRHSMVKVVN